MQKKFTYLLVFLLFLVACKKENTRTRTAKTFEEDPSIIQDQYGRQLILHGLNTSSSAKSEPLRNPWISEIDVEREATQCGFNFVRYLIFWDAIEPQKDVFDEAYLDRVEERVNWYASRGMYVMLDMHQDLYSAVFDGDGAPEWAIRANNQKPIDLGNDLPWWLKNIDPAIIASWINFWSYTEHKDLQDHYILAWQKVANRFKNNPYVIGYDLMNEPWAGDLIKAFITGEFERVQLTAFYNRLIPKLRAVDNEKYIFFEPTPAPVTFGAASTLKPIKDTRIPSKIVYAPHCYPYDTHEGLGYTAGSKKNLIDWEKQRKHEVSAAVHGQIPLVTGEFGLSPSNTDVDLYFKDFHNMSDRNQWHWAYWSNDNGGWSPFRYDGTETAIAQYLIRTYPKAVAGKINHFSFDMNSKDFKMSYTTNANIDMPTEIFIPSRFYPNGYTIEIDGISNYTTTFDEKYQTLSLFTSEDKKEVSVSIKAK